MAIAIVFQAIYGMRRECILRLYLSVKNDLSRLPSVLKNRYPEIIKSNGTRAGNIIQYKYLNIYITHPAHCRAVRSKFSTRAYTRCRICGRPHSVLKKYGICRICFRELAYKGQIPGVKKASWEFDLQRFYQDSRHSQAPISK